MILLIIVVGGCAIWKVEPEAPSDLPPPRMSSDAIGMEIAVLPVPGEITQGDSSLWRDVDEQHLHIDMRQKLGKNGFRSGIAGGQLPASLLRQIDGPDGASPAPTLNLDPNGNPVDLAPQRKFQRRQMRAGRRGKVLIGKIREEMVALLSEPDGVRGELFQQAQCLFSLTVFPLSDGRISVELAPEVEHGPVRQTWVGDEGRFRVAAEKKRHVFEDLRLTTLLSTGQTLLLTCESPPKGLGGTFFTPPEDKSEQIFLMIRLVQTQHDDIFAPDRIRVPLATPRD